MERSIRRHLPPVAILVMGLSGNSPAVAQVIQEYEYQPDRIYQVRTGLGITTQIELSTDENILDYSTGFSRGWDLTRRGNVFYLKPKNVDVDTNMMVRTETHAYIFELKVVATDWTALEQAKQAGVQYKVGFRYPNDARFSTEAITDAHAQLSTALVKDRHYHFGYDYATRSRESWLIPSNVYDDGMFTYLRLGLSGFPSGNFPAVFGREEESGDDFVVNTTVEQDAIVVHGTYPFLVIRHGDDVVLVRRHDNTRVSQRQ